MELSQKPRRACGQEHSNVIAASDMRARIVALAIALRPVQTVGKTTHKEFRGEMG
jgi:hypothetical protein